MADLRSNFAGIRSPNPFWLASAPPTDKAYNVHRAFEAGWGGVVWKTLGEDGPPIVNVNGPRYGALLTPDVVTPHVDQQHVRGGHCEQRRLASERGGKRQRSELRRSRGL
jgi:hypothetical protein